MPYLRAPRVMLCLLAWALLALPSNADWVATGQFSYTDRLYDMTGFTLQSSPSCD